MNQVVITGASRGLGLVTANYFADQGWQVQAIGLSARPSELSGQVDYHQFDLTDQAAASQFWQDLAASHPEDSISLINNAGGFTAGDLKTADLNDFHKQMAINYFTAVTMTQGLVKNIKKARIVNIVSAAALKPSPHVAAYGSAKAAVKQFYQSLQQELPKEQYLITNVYPDMMATGGDNKTGIEPLDVAKLLFLAAQSTNQLLPARRDFERYLKVAV